MFGFFIQRTASVDNDVTVFVQPEIVSTGEGLELDKTYIAFEGMTLCSFSQKNIVGSVLTLLSSSLTSALTSSLRTASYIVSSSRLYWVTGRGYKMLSINSARFHEIAHL